MGPTSTSTITCRSRKTRWRRARCTTISNRANSRARRPPASASFTRTSTVRCSTRIRVTRADSTCWSARTTTSTSRRRAATKTAWPSRWRGCATTIGTEAMKLFYGWIIVGVGIVVTCVGFGAMASLTVFLQPMATSMGWSRTGIAAGSAGLRAGSAIIGPLTRWPIPTYDWRFAMLVIGDIVWLVIIPAAFLVRDPPASTTAAGPGATAGADGPELTMAQALRTPQFAAIALTYFACCAAHSGPIFHMVTHAIDHGVPAMAAATVLSVASLASLSGKIVCGLVADRVGATRTLVAGLALQAVAVSLYVFTRDLASFYALAVMFGFAYGGVMPLYAILVREYFGARIMGTTFGAVAFVSTLGMALGPVAGGWLYDAFGSYFWLFIASSGIGLGAVAIAFTFRAPRALPTVLAAPSVAH